MCHRCFIQASGNIKVWSLCFNSGCPLRLQKGEILADADFSSGSRPHHSGKKPPYVISQVLSERSKSICWAGRSPSCRRAERGHGEQPSGAREEGLQAGGQREGLVRLPEGPPASTDRLHYPPVQPRWVKTFNVHPNKGGVEVKHS